MMTRVRIALLVTLILWILGGLLPETRLWGVGFLYPAPVWLWIATFAGAILGVAIVERWPFLDDRVSLRPGLPAVALVTGLVWVALFVLLRQATHFLGDGAVQLSTLALDQPVIKGHDVGTVHTLLAIKGLIGSGQESALTTYRVTAITSGFILVVAAFYLSARIFEDRAKAALFGMGHVSGGYMLLYFGYVENYALFVLSVSLFGLLGIAAATRRSSRWWVLPPFLAAVWFHNLGWTLLPALLYILQDRTRLSHRHRNMSLAGKSTLLVLAMSGLAALFYWKYTSDYFFRFLFVPPLADSFTVDDYTLFSLKHLIDFSNLYVLLVPGWLVGVSFLWSRHRDSRPRDPARNFLWLLFWSTAVAAFVVDPRLGMPRSWDLLAFAGVPAAMLLFYLVVQAESHRSVRVAVVCALLGWLVLLPRAYVQSKPEPSTRLARSYFTMDPQRSRTGVHVVGEYLLEHNYTAAYGRLADFRKRTYPEEALRDRLDFLFRDRKMLEALNVCQDILRLNPRMYEAWMFQGFIANNNGRHDSAAFYLQVADGLNPYTTGILNELGRAYYYSGRTDEALELWQRSLVLDSAQYVPLLAIGSWHKGEGNTQKASEYLARAAAQPGAPPDVLLQLVRDHAANNRFTEAQVELQRAIARDADTLKVRAIVEQYPMLAPPPTDTTRTEAPATDGP